MRSAFFSLSLLARLVFSQFEFSTPNFQGQFANGTGVLESLKPASNADFDFSPSDYFSLRTANYQYHTGDLTFRWRSESSQQWLDGDTAANRSASTAVSGPSTGPWTSSLNNALSNANSVFNITRTWAQQDGDLTLEFTIQNVASYDVELGSLGMPIEFNNIFVNRTPEDTTAQCVLLDPFIGLHAGYVQVTRLTGTGPNLVITGSTNDTKFEAWRFLHEPTDTPLGYQLQTFEGTYEWQVFTQAYAGQEWKDAQPWNPPTSKLLKPGDSLSVGLRFSIAPQVSDIEQVVSRNGKSVAVGIPGYVLPPDLVGKLFINSTMTVPAIDISPTGSLNYTRDFTFAGSWQGFDIRPAPNVFGRASITFTFADNSSHVVHYWIPHSGPTALSELGSYVTTKQWFTDTSDPFHRAPSIISYDHDADAFVLQDNRTWIPGLNNEGGCGAWVTAAIKQAYWPVADEINKLETYFNETVWGNQQSNGSADWPVHNFPGNSTQAKYGVRDSLFYYGLEGYSYSNQFTWPSQPSSEASTYSVSRAYDYVWNSALYWSLYKAGRTHPGILSRSDPTWYLTLAYNTVMFTQNLTNGQHNTDYYNVGLMGETIWGHILSDLVAENFTNEASTLEAAMRSRQKTWASESNPYGSELAWDSTGEEGVYYWSSHFGDTATAERTIERIRGYMPTVAHWGWNGNARRYWDFLYAGAVQLARIERQIHHYGSGLNALPLLAAYRNSSEPGSAAALYDLRVAYGGHQGALSNVAADGFGSMAFHSWPDTLRWDAYSGDYGPHLLGHLLGAATYLVKHPIFLWQSFGGNVASGGSLRDSDSTPIVVLPRDAVRKRIFVAPESLYVTFDAGIVDSFVYVPSSGALNVTVVPACVTAGDSACAARNGERAIMKFEQTAGKSGVKLDQKLERARGGYVVDIPPEGTTITFSST